MVVPFLTNLLILISRHPNNYFFQTKYETLLLKGAYFLLTAKHLLLVLTLIVVGETSHSLLSTMYIYFLLNSPIIRLFLSLLTMRLPFFARFSPDLIPHESFWSHEIYLLLHQHSGKVF